MRVVPDLARTAAPVLDALTIRARAEALRAGAPALRRLPLAARIAAVDRAAGAWLATGSPWRREAVARVAAGTGYARSAVERGVVNLWGALRAADVAAVAHAELGTPADGEPPALALHVLAGNVPGAGLLGVVGALVAGVPSLVKVARREPVLPALAVASLVDAEPHLAVAAAIASWSGEDAALTAAALADAEVVLAYGRGPTIDAIRTATPRRLLAFGPRQSLALVAREALTPATAAVLAEQTALFDQQGCLSPQVALVEDAGPDMVEAFARAVADALATLADTMPRAPLTMPEAAAVRRFLERASWRAQEGAPITVHADARGRFGVVVDRSDTPLASPLLRHLVVRPIPALGNALAGLAPFGGDVEAVGWAGPAERLGEAGAAAEACGAQRLCPLERLQAPPFAWRQSGHARLACFRAGAGVTPVPLVPEHAA